MRILFVTGGSPATVYALTPLATSARDAGHEVLVASNEETMAAVAGAGLPGVCVSTVPIRHHITHDRDGVPVPRSDDPDRQMRAIGHAFGRMAAVYEQPLLELGRAWRPDVVVGGTLTFSAPVLAARLGVPHVRHTWDSGEPLVVDGAAEVEMRPELDALGLDGIPGPALTLDVCPPSVRVVELPNATPMRWIPCNLQPTLQSWMYTRGSAPRVAVTAGTKVASDYFFDYLVGLVRALRGLDAEVLVSAPPGVAGELSDVTGVQVGWLPFDVVARTCDLLVHHAGGGTALTGMVYGVPQLLVPNMPKLVAPSQRLAEYGAARVVLPGDDDAETLAAAAQDLLATPGYAERAAHLAREAAAMPAPPEVLGLVEKLP